MMLVGQTIGDFEVQKEIGSGAMGSVYLCLYTKTNRKCAMKVIAAGLGDNERVQQRFDREAEILKQLKHPNIVRLLAKGRYHRSPFYVMEFIDGEPLDAVLQRKGRFTWEETIEIGKQICNALQHAHDHGIIHRDLKPSNLMWDKSGVLKLTDFGIAKDTDVTGLTSANSTVGTAAYMSPEQCRGERNLTNKSDLYSLGILLYELLTGEKPFHAENAMDMFIQHVQGTFERPAKVFPEIPIWLDTLVCQCLEKKPEHRPANAATVSQALDEVVQKVESRKSAGEEVAVRVARKSKSKVDRDAAEAMAGTRLKKKKKRGDDETPPGMPKALVAGFLTLLLVGLIALLVYLLLPPAAEELLAEGNRVLAEGDALFDRRIGNSDDSCWYKWEDAEKKYFNPLIARYPESPEAKEARAKVEYIEDGKAYIRGVRFVGPDRWRDAKKEYDRLLDKLKPGRPVEQLPGSKFIQKARQELSKYEAPKLLDDAQTSYSKLLAVRAASDPVNRALWAKAKTSLSTLVDRYGGINDPAGEAGKALYDRLLAYESAVLKALSDRSSNNDAEAKVIAAIKIEQANDEPAAVRQGWEAVRQYGLQAPVGARRPYDDPSQRPYLDLANDKLQRLANPS